MRAGILNASPRNRSQRLGSLPPWEGLPPEVLEFTANPTLFGKEFVGAPVRETKFSADKMIGFVQSGAKLQAAGSPALGGINFSAMAAAMGAGAAIGAAFGGVGAPIGAAIGAVYFAIQTFTGGVARDWVDAAPGVHDWFTVYGPEAFLQFVRSDRPELLGTNAVELTKALLLWWVQNDGIVISDAPGSYYSGVPNFVYYNMAGGYEGLKQLYTPLGIDFPKTRLEQHPAGTQSADGTSTGAGGVWMIDRKMYVPEGTVTTPEDVTDLAPDESATSNAGGVVLGLSAIGFILSKLNS